MFDYPDFDQICFFEVAVINPCCHDTVLRASRTPLHAARVRQNTKESKYGSKASNINMGLRRTVFETTGAMGPDLLAILKRASFKFRNTYGKRDAAVAWSGASFVSYWMQRMSIDMARGLLFMREAQQHKASISKAIRMARQAPCAPKKSMVAKRVTMGGPVGLSPGALLRSQRASPEPSPSRPHHTGATASQVWQADHALQGSPPQEGSEPSPILSQQ